MITGELKNKVDSIWTMFWTGGITNPLDVIEQITYLIFIRDLDDMDNTRTKESTMLGVPYESIFTTNKKQYKWSVFRDFPAAKMYEVIQDKVFPFIKKLHDDKNSTYSKYMDDAIFKIPTPSFLKR
jgi:type I restriction enzyme M protein